MMRIFISYARQDEAPARRLYAFLATLDDVQPWLDKEDLLPGATWEDEIENAIATCDILILLLSKQLVSREGFIQREVRLALSRLAEMPPGRIFLIPARLDDTVPTHRELRKLQWVDLHLDWFAGLDRIKLAIANTVRARGLPVRLVPPNTAVAGRWRSSSGSEFTVSFPNGHLDIAGLDPSDGELYQVLNADWDGKTLTMAKTMPSTKWTTLSTLTMAGRDKLIGTLDTPDTKGREDEWTRLA